MLLVLKHIFDSQSPLITAANMTSAVSVIGDSSDTQHVKYASKNLECFVFTILP